MKTDSSSPLEKEPIAKECNKNMGKIKSASHASPPDECQCTGHGAGSRALAPCGTAEWTLMLLPQPPSDSPGLRELRRQRPGSAGQPHGIVQGPGHCSSTLACLHGCGIPVARLQSGRERGVRAARPRPAQAPRIPRSPPLSRAGCSREGPRWNGRQGRSPQGRHLSAWDKVRLSRNEKREGPGAAVERSLLLPPRSPPPAAAGPPSLSASPHLPCTSSPPGVTPEADGAPRGCPSVSSSPCASPLVRAHLCHRH